MKISFKSTQHKIAIIFAALAGLLIIVTTFVAIFYVRFSIDNKAKQDLKSALGQNVSEYESGVIEEKNVQYKQDTKSTKDYLEENILPNLRSQKEVYDEKTADKEAQSENDIVNIADDADLTDLENQKGIYSRVIQENGDILITSELFETYYVNPDKQGFQKYYDNNTCIYSYTENITSGNNAGSTVQVADYCSFSRKQERTLYLIMGVIGIVAVFFSYIFGFVYALLILKPLKESTEKTKQFTQDCYHELLTPVAVAMSTAESKKRTQEYKEGLLSVEEDLKNILDSLNILKSKALIDQANYIFEDVRLDEILGKIISEQQALNVRSDVKLEKNIQSPAIKKTDSRCMRLIFINLISNALKYTKPDGTIKIKLDNNEFTIENEVENITNENIQNWIKRNVQGKNGKTGSGIGLSIVQELVKELKWQMDIESVDNNIRINILFE